MSKQGHAPLHHLRRVVRQQGVYAVVRDAADNVLLVRTASGRCYLPGGRVEPGESEGAALLRELAEECGWSARIGAPLCSCDQPIMDGRVMLAARYWHATLVDPLPSAPEHDLLWLPASEALTRVHRPGDQAALVLVAYER